MSAQRESTRPKYGDFNPLRFPPCACAGCRARAEPESPAERPAEPVSAPEQPR
ncbi:hypothetical protein EES47_29495 [Streptomyces sp. ADI98-12]|nr:hypothetical protein EES47_29495 [Streptomyces sp. ADI98-12]